MPIFWIACTSILLSVAAQFCLKAGMSADVVRAAMAEPARWRTLWVLMTHWPIVGGFVLYGLGAVLWLGVLSRWDVSKAYPLLGLGFGVTVIVGVFLGEQVSLPRTAGVLLICAGVALVARS